MADEKTRVDFNAPASLVERADVIADLLDTSRTRLLIDALRDELDEFATDDKLQRQLKEGYYAGRIDFETVAAVLETEEALRMRLLRESLDRDPPAPEPPATTDLPTQEAFYDGDISEWRPDLDKERADAETRS